MALKLAQKGAGRTTPNPLVGAVVVKKGHIVGKGYHRKAGGPHAEAEAIRQSGSEAKGATLYVSLEPCCHLDKRTPPCVHSIIDAGIRRVFIGTRDPNPRVNGKGVKALRKAGISVDEGVMKAEAIHLNEIYNKYILVKKPFIVLKAAMTLDGKIAPAEGGPYWISGKEARLRGHALRDQMDAILVGINTVLTDNPRLTTRLPSGKGRDPLRIIVDTSLRIPLSAKVLNEHSGARTLIATTSQASSRKIRAVEKKNAEVMVVPQKNLKVSLSKLMQKIGEKGVSSLLIEGGGEINASALKEGIVDKMIFFISPQVMGKREAVGVFRESGLSNKGKPIFLKNVKVEQLGRDLMLEGYL